MGRFCCLATALVIGLFSLSWGSEEVAYEGLRVDISALSLNRDIISVIVPALNRTLSTRFPVLKEAGAFGTELTVKELRVTFFKIEENRLEMNRFEYKAPVYTLKGAFEAIYFHVAFDFVMTWIGIPLSSGKGAAAITNIKSEVLVFFNESDPDVQIPHPWDVKNLTLSGLFVPTSWTQTLMHKHFVPLFHKAVDDAMFDFAHNLLKTYRYIEDIFPDDIDLVFRNDILSVTPTVHSGYLSIAFKTNITVNTHMHRKMYRRMSSSVVPQGDFDYCLAAELVPDVLDALGKEGYLDHYISPENWGFSTNQIREFFEIMPDLARRFKGDEEFRLIAMVAKQETVNDLAQRDAHYQLLELQYPITCYVYVPSVGTQVLVVNVYLRFYYDIRNKGEGYFGDIARSFLYEFKTTPDLPTARRLRLEASLLVYAHSFEGRELLSPGLRVNPNRHNELQFMLAYTKPEEICFYYKEKRSTST